MSRTGVAILRLSELRCTRKGHFESEDHRIFDSGHASERKNEVAIVFVNMAVNCVMSYNPVCDRIMTVRIQGNPMNLALIQVYAPTAAASDAD